MMSADDFARDLYNIAQTETSSRTTWDELLAESPEVAAEWISIAGRLIEVGKPLE